jgi:phosphatidylserine decarboxylase
MNALTYATAQILRVIPRARVSRVMGRLADVAWSPRVGRAVVSLYSRAYDVCLDECVEKEGWSSFDAFFTRALKEDARPIAREPGVIVCPADGRLESPGPIDEGRTFHVKGRPYRVEELVGDAEEARRFAGGAGFVVYLSPRDYHRVHSPVDGKIGRVRSMPGDYFPVNSIGMRHVPNLFVRNRRVAIEIDTPDVGRVTVVMVVAMIVGRITVTGIDDRDVPLGDHQLDLPVTRGAELGMFHLGSTCVVLMEPRAAGRWLMEEGPCRYGQPLMRARASNGEGR